MSRLTVLELRAMRATVNQQDIFADAPPSQRPEAEFHFGWEGGSTDVEAQFDRGCYLVDVLATWPGRANESFVGVEREP